MGEVGLGMVLQSRSSAALRGCSTLLGKDGQEWGSRGHGGHRELRKRSMRMRHWHRHASGGGMGTGD